MENINILHIKQYKCIKLMIELQLGTCYSVASTAVTKPAIFGKN